MLNTELLFKLIDNKYEGSRIEIKINKFCKDCKIKTYRFKRAVENKCYLLQDEIFRIIQKLDLTENQIIEIFFNKKELEN